jgi:hypothetical protein
LSYCAYAASISWLAVRTHRCMLLGPESARTPTVARGRDAVTKYLGVAVAGVITYVALVLLVALVVMNLLFLEYVPAAAVPPPREPGPEMQQMIDRVMFAVSLVPAYLVARLVLVLPAIALEQKLDPRAAWGWSRRNGWRLVLAIFLLPKVLNSAIQWLLDASGHVAILGAVAVLNAIVLSLEIIVLSLSYRELAAAPATPPTPRPS